MRAGDLAHLGYNWGLFNNIDVQTAWTFKITYWPNEKKWVYHAGPSGYSYESKDSVDCPIYSENSTGILTVAIMGNSEGFKGIQILNNKQQQICHTGYGANDNWTRE
jgi:hypothetical protein